MVEVNKGVKAGVASGVVYGLVNAIANMMVMGVILPSVFPEFFVAVFESSAMIILVVQLIAGAIIGSIFGFIFSILYKALPGRTSVIKGVIFSFVQWIISLLALQQATSVGWPPPEARFLVFIPIMVSLGTSILWGILIGYFWDRFSLNP